MFIFLLTHCSVLALGSSTSDADEVVAVGSPSSLDLSGKVLLFKPAGSRVSSFDPLVPDMQGSYVFTSSGSTGGAATVVQGWDWHADGRSPKRFFLHDTFRHTYNVSAGYLDSDEQYRAWRTTGNATIGGGFMQLGPGDAASFNANLTEIDFFSQPVNLTLSSVFSNGPVVLNITLAPPYLPRSQGLVVSIETLTNRVSVAAPGRVATGLLPEKCTASSIGKGFHGMQLELLVLARSASIGARCSPASALVSPPRSGAGVEGSPDYPAPLPVIAQLKDTGIDWRDWARAARAAPGQELSVGSALTLSAGTPPSLPRGAASMKKAADHFTPGRSMAPDTTYIAFGEVVAESTLYRHPGERLPAVLLPVPNLSETSLNAPPLGKGPAAATDGLGFLDPTKQPFGAIAHPPSVLDAAGDDEDARARVLAGLAPSTVQLQRAMDWARSHASEIRLPYGLYVINDTLWMNQTEKLSAVEPLTKDKNYWQGARLNPVVVRGVPSPAGDMPVIALPASQAGFTNASEPRALIHSVMINAQGKLQPNANANQVVQDVRVVIGRGNFGAVGIYARGAQGVSMQNVRIEAGDGLAGFSGASGSGGSHIGVHVTGGRYGIDFTAAQPAPVATGFTSVNARCSGLAYAGLQTLTAVGLNITMEEASLYAPIVAGCPLPLGCELPQMHNVYPCTSPAVSSQLSLIDSVINMGQAAPPQGDKAAIRAGTALYAENLYVRGRGVIARFPDGFEYKTEGASLGAFVRVPAFGYGVQPPPLPPTANRSLHAAVYVDGVNQSQPLYNKRQSLVLNPPVDLQSRHLFEGRDPASLPDWRTPTDGAVRADALGAMGDYVTDDYPALQAAADLAAKHGPGLGRQGLLLIPRGVYRLSQTLKIQSGVCVVGAGLHLTSLVPDPSTDLANASVHVDSTGRSRLIGAPVLLMGSDRTREQAESRANPPGGDAVSCLARMSITVWGHQANTSAFEWRAPRPAYYYQVHTNRKVACGVNSGSPLAGVSTAGSSLSVAAAYAETPPPCEPQVSMHVPLAAVVGGAAQMVNYYNEDPMNDQAHQPVIAQAPVYRHLLTVSSCPPSKFSASDCGPPSHHYHLNPEHALSEADSEIADSQGVQVYGIKSEGFVPPLWIRDSANVLMSGHGGVAKPPGVNESYPSGFDQYTPSLYRVERSENVTLANLWRYVFGNVDFSWSAVLLVDKSGKNFTTGLGDRPIVFVVGAREPLEDEA